MKITINQGMDTINQGNQGMDTINQGNQGVDSVDRIQGVDSVDRIQGVDSVDRISELPDSILCEILSYLPTKLSVSTSVLAKRWRFVWTNVTNFDLNGQDHSEKPTKLSAVIDRILGRHNVKVMDTFRLILSEIDTISTSIDYLLETWFAIAITRNVQNFRLYNFHRSLAMLPRSIFTTKTFVDLRLALCVLPVPLPEDLCFPLLKTLHLEAVGFDGSDVLDHLISACPVLEELLINELWNGDSFVWYICSPTLKRLMVYSQGYYWLSDDGGNDFSYHFEIDAPALRYLRVEDRSSDISTDYLQVLTEADICIKSQLDEDAEEDHTEAVLIFVNGLRNVSRLKLSIDYATFLDWQFMDSYSFDNLTKLELSADWRFITMFLQYAANLEVLIISKVDNEELKCWMEPIQVPMCLVLHLITVRIDQFRYAEYEFKMVRYLLCNAQVLKTMEICFDAQGPFEQEKDSAVERISQFERGSKACELHFH